jgi:hypothetical protein
MFADSSSHGNKPSNTQLGWRGRQRRRRCIREGTAARLFVVRSCIAFLWTCCRPQQIKSLTADQQWRSRKLIEPDCFPLSKPPVGRRTMLSSLSCTCLVLLPACGGQAMADAGNPTPPMSESQLADLLRPATKEQPPIPLPSSVPDVQMVIAEGISLTCGTIDFHQPGTYVGATFLDLIVHRLFLPR